MDYRCRKCACALVKGENWRGLGSSSARVCVKCDAAYKRQWPVSREKAIKYQETRKERRKQNIVNTAVCKKCQVVLVEGVNWYGRGKSRGRQCNDCFNAYIKTWLKTPTGQTFKSHRAHWHRTRYLGQRVNGVRQYIAVSGKRDPTDSCEMCDQVPKRLVYHHWNDADYSQGIWICQSCHNIAHGVERDLDRKYRELKRTLTLKVVTK